MEPERKIEKLLRAYAKKRRAQAGDPLSLHPATRRLLQGEVARRTQQADGEDSSISLWELFRQRWAVLVGFTLVVFLGASLFLPSLSAAKHKAQSVGALNNLKQIGVAAQMSAEENNGMLPLSLDALTNGFVPDNIFTDPVSGQRFAYIAGGKNLDSLESNAVLAYSPVDKNGRAVLFADGRVEFKYAAVFSGLTNQKSLQLAMADQPARQPEAKLPANTSSAAGTTFAERINAGRTQSDQIQNATNVANVTAMSGIRSEYAASKSEAGSAGSAGGAGEVEKRIPGSTPPTAVDTQLLASADKLLALQKLPDHNITVQQNVSQINLDSALPTMPLAGSLASQSYFKNTAAQTGAEPVLANFQVQQNGNAIRILDDDGSVYDGSLLSADMINAEPNSVAASSVNTAANYNSQQAVQNVSFRVAGMNRTLKQTVVFIGSAQLITAQAANVQQNFGSAPAGNVAGNLLPQNIANQSQQGVTWNARIIGTAVIGQTNQIEVNAMPVTR